jgi:hypothetical protein
MKLTHFCLIFSLIFATLTCSKTITQSGTKPPKVVLIPAVSDTSRVEKGIDAVPEKNAIRIEWIPCQDETVVKYEIYRKSDAPEAKFVQIGEATEADSFYVDDVQTGVRYFYTVTAVNDEDLRSESGDTLSYLLLQKAVNLQPKGEIANSKPVFTWNDPNQAQEYIIRVVDNLTNQPVWISVVPTNYELNHSVAFNADQKAVSGLLSGSLYRWRIDVRGQNYSGSESVWVSLKIR